jgi:crotonobetainyl-CoA:carnitine CoA-transferase CaiB-like acyl-CoA transferase
VTRQRIHIAGFSHEADEALHRDPGIAPLADVRVLDLTDGRLGMTGRYLADLGADVVRAEPPGGCQSRHAEPLIAGHGVRFLVGNANKRGVVVNLNDPAGREDFRELVAASDILVESAAPGTPEAAALGPGELASANPRLVHVSVTDFGRTGPLRDWHGTSDVHLALSGALARSGLPGREPLLPPEYLVYASATVQVAWTTLLAYYHRLQTGHGDHVDFSVLEALVQNLDPGFGIGGSARGALSPADLPRGRPDARQLYPIFPCADGWCGCAC